MVRGDIEGESDDGIEAPARAPWGERPEHIDIRGEDARIAGRYRPAGEREDNGLRTQRTRKSQQGQRSQGGSD